MSDVWSYEGKRVLVTGGGGAGMGAAAVTELVDLGAEVHVMDIKEPPIDVASYQNVDLRDPDATVAAVESVGGELHSLFYCAGLPGAPFSDVDTMLVNFAAVRVVADAAAQRMPNGGAMCSISSTAGAAYRENIEKWLPLVKTESFADAKAWCEANPAEIEGGYAQSKEALCIWTMYAAKGFQARNIRLNSICPGPTDTPMMPAFEETAGGPALIDLFAQGVDRRSTPEEQAYPMIFLNSGAATYVSGENMNTDGGTINGIAIGTIELDFEKALGLG